MNYTFVLTFLGCLFMSGLHKFISAELSAKVTGGTDATPREFPWIVSIWGFANGLNRVGAGVIYNKDYIITAANLGCDESTQSDHFNVVAGDYKLNGEDGTGQTRSVSHSQIKCHPNYTQFNHHFNDIAVWKLSSSWDLDNDFVKAADLAQTGFIPAKTVTFAGWGPDYPGGDDSNTLQKVVIPIVSYSKCSSSWAHINQNSQLCAGAASKGACTRDAGGLLHSGTTVCGILSYIDRTACGNPDRPAVFANVAYFYKWIYDSAI